MAQIGLSFQLAAYGQDLAGDLPRVLAHLRQLGYDHAVIPPALLNASPPSALGREFAAAGVAPVMMFSQAPHANVSAEDAAVREAGRELLYTQVDTAHEVGAPRITGLAYGLIGDKQVLPGSVRWHSAAESVAQAADHAAAAGILPSVEVLNRYETSLLNTVDDALDFLRAGGSEHLGIHLDTFHMAIEEEDPAAAVRRAGAYLAYLELGQSGRGRLSAGSLDLGTVLQSWQNTTPGCLLGVEAFTRYNLPEAIAENLSIWRVPFEDGSTVATDATQFIGALLARQLSAATADDQHSGGATGNRTPL